MVLAVAHVFGFYNPKQLADFLEVPHQQFSPVLKEWSVYQVKKMLLRFMVKQAAEKLKPVMSKSAATRSRAGIVCPNQRLAVAPFLELKKSKRSFRTREALYFQ